MRPGDGNDVITGFTTGAGRDDVIRLSGFGTDFDTFAEVEAAATQSGSDVVIAFIGSDTLTIEDATLAQLHEDDFAFV